jgi:hypothetical protein
MKRRTLLRAAGAALGTGTLAGCLADDGGTGGPGGDGDAGGTDPSGTETPSPGTDTPTDTTDTADEGSGHEGTAGDPEQFAFDPEPDDPFQSETIGSRDAVENPDDNRPHGVAVWNAADRERSIGVAVRRGSATVFDRTLTFPADGYLSLTLAEPADYTVSLRAGDEHLEDVDVGRSWFDCNSSSTQIGVLGDGEVRSTTVSTMVACDADGVSGSTTFESGEGSCAGTTSATEAAVSFGDDQLAVDGTIRASDPCHRAVLADVSESDDAVTLTVGVESASEGTTACVDCVGAVDYRATMTYGVTPPSEVTVVHESRGETSTVTVADR